MEEKELRVKTYLIEYFIKKKLSKKTCFNISRQI